jgi:hypothetical protein
LQKATVKLRNFRPSVRMEQLGSQWTDFHEIWYLNIFRKSDEKIKVFLKSDKNNGHFTCRSVYIYDTDSLSSSQNQMFRTEVSAKIRTCILCSITFLRKSYRVWDNVEKYGRTWLAAGNNMVQRTRLVCWIPETTNAHSKHVILIAFPSNSGYANAPHCCVFLRTLGVLLKCNISSLVLGLLIVQLKKR